MARSHGSRRVQAFFAELFAIEGKPKFLRADNGREFIGKELDEWLTAQGVTILFIEKASPQQNAFVERFHRSMRSEALNVEEFDSVLEARVVIGEWRQLYNNVRRHRGLGMKTPAAFRAEAKQQGTPPKGRLIAVGRRGVDESLCHHPNWTSRATLPRGANPTPKRAALSQPLARLMGAVQPLLARHPQVERDRAPPVHLHLHELAGTSAHRDPHHRRALIAATNTTTGLTVQCAYNPSWYPTGENISHADFNAIPLRSHHRHGDWNYDITAA